MRIVTKFTIVSSLALALTLPSSLAAQDAVTQEDEENQDNIIVTGALRQGGAQDARRFRKAAETGMPRPEMLSVEGLMGEHDLTLPAANKCNQMFCLVSESMTAALPTRPDDKLFVGLGFATNIDEKLYKRPALNLVAVVDKSGSMSGEPLELVRQSLRQIVSQMQDDDQLSIVLYGDRSHVWMQPAMIKGNRKSIISRINAIESAGSTNMEEGLQVGYKTAYNSQKNFSGQTRLMLFTDENPNVGDVSAEGFMGMAIAASERDVGLTTIGVGHIFDDTLATKVSSVRGGNLFFIDDEAAVSEVFTKQFETMGGEVAHDLKLTITPAAGWAATGVFGVPDKLMTNGKDGAITVVIPTVFLSTNGGGIYVTLGKSSDRQDLPAGNLVNGAELVNVSLSYNEARSGKSGADQISVKTPGDTPSQPLRLSQTLVDEFLTLRAATTAYHIDNEPKKAHSLLSDLNTRMKTANLAALKPELQLIANMQGEAAYYSGYTSELPTNIRHRAISGKWRVVRTDGFKDIFKGNMLTFEDDGTMTTKRDNPPRGIEEEDSEEFVVNERELLLRESDMVFSWQLNGNRLVLKDREIGSGAQIVLERYTES